MRQPQKWWRLGKNMAQNVGRHARYGTVGEDYIKTVKAPRPTIRRYPFADKPLAFRLDKNKRVKIRVWKTLTWTRGFYVKKIKFHTKSFEGFTHGAYKFLIVTIFPEKNGKLFQKVAPRDIFLGIYNTEYNTHQWT